MKQMFFLQIFPEFDFCTLALSTNLAILRLVFLLQFYIIEFLY